MKYLVSQLTYFISQSESRKNLKAFGRYLIFLTAVVFLYAALFKWLKQWAEGEHYSWVTSFYWTIVTMSTLGFGDITFATDIGRSFSTLVLLSGVVSLLIMLPFTFIRSFYAPWLEAQLRLRAPREVPQDTKDHVIICRNDSIAPGLIEKLVQQQVPYFLLETDPIQAARQHGDGISVIFGDFESRQTYERLRVDRCRLLLANAEDAVNANITLTVHEVEPRAKVVAIANYEDSIDIIELAGADYVLPLTRRLGDHLANRIEGGREKAHIIGRFHDLLIAEFPVHDTELAGKRIRETKLREKTGLNVVGVWQHGRLLPARPETLLERSSVPVVVGTSEQLLSLNEILASTPTNLNPVVIIGGGKVGRSVVRALKRKGVLTHLVERKEELRKRIDSVHPDRVFFGDAADRDVLFEAGINEAPSVILTTNDDATNIYLCIYCRRLNPKLRIVSRVTHERNVEAIHRAGADFVLSYATLGVESVLAFLQGREPIMVGEGVELFHLKLPASLENKTLKESGIGKRTGLNVIAVEDNGKMATNPPASYNLKPGASLLMIGSSEQRLLFLKSFR